jgi:phosphate transport system substrate-binding protein
VKARAHVTLLVSVLGLGLAAAGCGGDDGGGTIVADGSSTVRPFVTKAAEDFTAQEGVDVDVEVGITGDVVGEAGTGGGFERFCRDEIDLSNASRPMNQEEQAICEEEGVDYLEFHVATDALTNVVSEENDWVTCLTVDQLKAIWEPGSKLRSWNQVDPSFPEVPLRLFGPDTDSGTFDYFTAEIVGEEGASRADYARSEEDNVIVARVADERGSLGYLGHSYFEENQDRLKALEVDGGQGCVAPSAKAAQDGTYTPFSRPLFVYVRKRSFDDNEDVRKFVKFMLDNQRSIAEAAQFVPLADDQLAEEQAKYEEAAA